MLSTENIAHLEPFVQATIPLQKIMAKQALVCFWASNIQNESWYQYPISLKTVTSSFTNVWHQPLFMPLDGSAKDFRTSVNPVLCPVV